MLPEALPPGGSLGSCGRSSRSAPVMMRQALRTALQQEQPDVVARVRVVPGRLGALPDDLRDRRYDVVCCHGVLMYLQAPRPAVVELSDLVAPAGVLSLLARNADGMALRPGLRRDWAGVQQLLDSAETDHPEYVNGLGLPARADRLEELASYVARTGPSASPRMRP